MSDLVDPAVIERTVGARRQRKYHLARLVPNRHASGAQNSVVYILHSQNCVDTHSDLRHCRFSRALDAGLKLTHWVGVHPWWRPVVVTVRDGRLVPAKRNVHSTWLLTERTDSA